MIPKAESVIMTRHRADKIGPEDKKALTQIWRVAQVGGGERELQFHFPKDFPGSHLFPFASEGPQTNHRS